MFTKVVAVKLVSGEEIIGGLVPDGLLTVDRPRMLVMQHQPNGTVGVGMIPWMISNVDGKVTIKPEAVVARVDHDDLPKGLVDGYLQQTSGIALAGANDALIKSK